MVESFSLCWRLDYLPSSLLSGGPSSPGTGGVWFTGSFLSSGSVASSPPHPDVVKNPARAKTYAVFFAICLSFITRGKVAFPASGVKCGSD